MTTHTGTPQVPVMPDASAITTRSDLGIVRVSGTDARTFLQGQFTSDIQNLDKNQTQLSGYCTPKGRLLAIFRIIPHENDLLLVLPRELLAGICKRLQLYVLRADVQLQDISDDFGICELAGPNIAAWVPGLPDIDNSVVRTDELSITRLPGDRLRLCVIGPMAALNTLRTQADQHITSVPAEAWRLLDIRAGLPTIYAATSEMFVPQMTNLHQVGGVSFKKGCYTGQEVVARMHYLGKQKKQLYRLHITTEASLQIGQPLYTPDSRGQAVGTIADQSPCPDGGYEVLAVCQTNSIQQLSLIPDGSTNSDICQRPLPYTNSD